MGLKASLIEQLESRRLLAASIATLTSRTEIWAPFTAGKAEPTYELAQAVPTPTPSTSAYTPAQIRAAYGFNNINLNGIVGDGSGQTIAIIDAFDDAKFLNTGDPNFNTSDLHKFDLQFGLPDPPSFLKVNQNGQSSPLPVTNSGWDGEIALDVEWSHAIAPGANILLIEGVDNGLDNLMLTSADTARNWAGVSVVSMSFSSGEFTGEDTSYDSHFLTPANHQGVTFLAATGDTGSPGGYPAYSPNVVAVGGTRLNPTLTQSTSSYISESTWGNGSRSARLGASGGGKSSVEPRPIFQSSVTLSGSTRTIPDLSFDADPKSGVAVYDSVNGGSSTPWFQDGGTSLSSPVIAATLAIANQARVANGMTTMDGHSFTLPHLYSIPAADYHDITSGSSNSSFSAAVGYDLVTGRGTPIANTFLNDLSGVGPTVVQQPASPTLQTDSGTPGDGITDVATPTFTGSATANSTVKLFASGTQVGSGTAGIGGSYSITTSALTDATYNVTATATVGVTTSTPSPASSLTIDTVDPTVAPATFQSDTRQALIYQFNEALGTEPATLTVQNLTTQNSVDLTGTYSSQTHADTFALNSGMLPNGNYQVTLSPSAFHDVAGNPLAGTSPDSFSVLAGDANGDGTVNALDFNAIAANYGRTNANFSEGDFSYDGRVSSPDFAILAANFGDNASTPGAAPLAAAQSAVSMFSDAPLADSDLRDLI